MANHEKAGLVTYEKISQLTGKTRDAIYQDASRGNLDLDDPASIAVYLARHGMPELKQRILLALTERDLDLSVTSKKRDAFLAKRSASRAKQAKQRKGNPPKDRGDLAS